MLILQVYSFNLKKKKLDASQSYLILVLPLWLSAVLNLIDTEKIFLPWLKNEPDCGHDHGKRDMGFTILLQRQMLGL